MHEQPTCTRLSKTPTSDGRHLAGLVCGVPEYIRVPEGKGSRKKLDETDAEAVQVNARQIELKMKAHRLRHLFRRARNLHRNQSKHRPEDEALHRRFRSGELEREFYECAREHGYGLVRSTGEMLQAGSVAPRTGAKRRMPSSSPER